MALTVPAPLQSTGTEVETQCQSFILGPSAGVVGSTKLLRSSILDVKRKLLKILSAVEQQTR